MVGWDVPYLIVIARGMKHFYSLICSHYLPDAISNSTQQKHKDCFGGRMNGKVGIAHPTNSFKRQHLQYFLKHQQEVYIKHSQLNHLRKHSHKLLILWRLTDYFRRCHFQFD